MGITSIVIINKSNNSVSTDLLCLCVKYIHSMFEKPKGQISTGVQVQAVAAGTGRPIKMGVFWVEVQIKKLTADLLFDHAEIDNG